MSRETPVFLVGAERSGSTVLRLILDYHPKIKFLSEHEFLVDYMLEDGQLPAIEEYRAALANN